MNLLLPLAANRIALSGGPIEVNTGEGGDLSMGGLEFLDNNTLLYNQRSVFVPTGAVGNKNTFSYQPVGNVLNNINPANIHLYGEIKRTVNSDGSTSYYIPSLWADANNINAYTPPTVTQQAFYNADGYTWSGSMPTQVYKEFGQSVPVEYGRTVGNKVYQLSDHLGNVRVVITDKKIIQSTDNLLDATDYFVPEVVSYSDYYPFGMQMNGRHGESGSYRYGFNGKENDNEIKGAGNHLDFGARCYDGRLGKFLSTDPYEGAFVSVSPYHFAGNNPILNIDYDGLYRIRATVTINGSKYKMILNTRRLTSIKVKGKSIKNHRIHFKTNDDYRKELVNKKLTRWNSKGELNYSGLLWRQRYSPKSMGLLVSKTSYDLKEKGRDYKYLKEPIDDGNGPSRTDLIDAFLTETDGVRLDIDGNHSIRSDFRDPNGVTTYENDFVDPQTGILDEDAWVKFQREFTKRRAETVATMFSSDEVSAESRFDGADLEKYNWFKFKPDKGYDPVGINIRFNVDGNKRIRKINDKKGHGKNPRFMCFVGSTEINLKNSVTKRIDEIKVGDTILSVEKRRVVEDVVLKVDSVIHDDIVAIVFSDSTKNCNTFDHPYYVIGKGWCSYAPEKTLENYKLKVQQLSKGDVCLKFENGKLSEVKVVSINEVIGAVMTYNLSRLKYGKSYLANGIKVHNESSGEEKSMQ